MTQRNRKEHSTKDDDDKKYGQECCLYFASKNYSLIQHESVESVILSSLSSSVGETIHDDKRHDSKDYPTLPNGTLCWVLLSKGIRKRKSEQKKTIRKCDNDHKKLKNNEKEDEDDGCNSKESLNEKEQSKENKNNEKYDDENDNDDNDDYDEETEKDKRNDDDDEQLQRSRQAKQKRKELFLRARVVQYVNNYATATTNNSTTRNSIQSTRVLVRYPKGSTYHVERANLIPVLETTTTPTKIPSIASDGSGGGLVLIAPETFLYRRLAVVHTNPNDVFIEIGCDYGVTCHRIWKFNHNYNKENKITTNQEKLRIPYDDCDNHSKKKFVNKYIGIDKSPISIQGAKERYPDCYFQVCDIPLDDDNDDNDTNRHDHDKTNTNSNGASNDSNKDPSSSSSCNLLPKLQSLLHDPSDTNNNKTSDMASRNGGSNNSNYDDHNSNYDENNLVVAIDINGNRELRAVLKCLKLVIQEWRPRLIFVKSRSLYSYTNEQ